MANLIRDPRHQRLLVREFGLREGYVSSEVEPTVQPIALIADLISRDSTGDAPYTQSCIASSNNLGGGANGAYLLLRNESPNTVAVVRRIIVSDPDQAGTVWGISTFAFGAGGEFAPSYTNRRITGRPATRAFGLASAGGAPAPDVFGVQIPGAGFAAAVTPVFDFNGLAIVLAPLAPGGAVGIANWFHVGTKGIGKLWCTVFWDELPA